jgi:simple sugar transport system permease protein
MPNITREMIVVIQGLVILFAGALEFMYRPALVRIYQNFVKR